jgi:hypothetical protein
MAVHDVGTYTRDVLKPGQVFSLDPQLRVPEENLYLRYEDVVVVTETGVENFTDFLPSELGDIEKLVGRGGLLQVVPPVSEDELRRLSEPNRRTADRADEMVTPADRTVRGANGHRRGRRFSFLDSSPPRAYGVKSLGDASIWMGSRHRSIYARWVPCDFPCMVVGGCEPD